jgi:beta-lactamase regulating signal transducer with metallopeptidase domain
VQFLWQGILLGLLAWLALRLLENARPQLRYAVACLALLACAWLPLWQLVQRIGQDGAIAVSTMPAAPVAAGQVARTAWALAPASWPLASGAVLPWIVLLWAVGAGVLSLRMLAGLHWVHRLRRTSMPCAGRDWQARLDRLAQRFGLKRPIGLRVVAAGESPLSLGVWRPLVLVPAALLARMPADLLEALLAHELAHIRRHDYLVNLLQGVVETLLFYHPVVWWLSHRIRLEREQVADELAAAVLGEPRRLAVALSELDRLSLPLPRFAQGAHGGQLMSRIQQLVRPRHHPIGSRIVLPLLGLVAASLAFYAHAQIAGHNAAPVAEVAPVPQAAPAVTAPPAPSATAARPADVAPEVVATNRAPHPQGAAHDGYALVRPGQRGLTMSSDIEDMQAIDDARKHLGGDFLWFRRDGKDYVVRDPALLARVQDAWQSSTQFDAQMQALDRQMEGHNAKLQAMSRRMAKMSAEFTATPAMRASEEKIQGLARKLQAIASQQQERAQAMADASEAERSSLDREIKALDEKRAAIDRQIRTLSETLEASTRTLEANRKPMEALGREMEIAGKPMEALGKQMEALGRQQEHAATQADAATRRLIQQALDQGLATPAPGAVQTR